MEATVSETNGKPHKKLSLKKQLSFDEKVTEFSLATGEAENLGCKKHKETLRWWTPSDKSSLGCYCRSSSVHGLQYLGAEGIHLGERILWGIVFFFSVISAVWLIRAVLIKYFDSPVVVTFQPSELFIGDVPFPAVTICNMNRVLKSKAEAFIKVANQSDDNDVKVQKARKDVYYLDHVCSVSNKPFSKMFNYSMKRGSVDPALLAKVHLGKQDEDVADVRNFLRKASQGCGDMIQLCMWEGNVLDCAEVFRPIETNFGKCCVFNMVPQTLLNRYTNDSRDTEELLNKWKEFEENIEGMFADKTETSQSTRRPRHQNRAGKASGLMFLADPALDQYFCSSSDSTGFRLNVHFSTDVPHVTDFGLAVRPNYEHFITVTPDVILADEDVRNYAIEKRNCYFEGEFSLRYYTIYSAPNCLDECVSNITYQRCNCVRYYMPRDDSRDICSPANFTCAEDVKKSLFKSGVKDMCKQCLPTCQEVRYSASSTMAPLQRLDLWVDDETNITAPWAKSNVSIVHVYFGQDSTYPKVRSQLYGITDLIANTGGLLGLCMGFSMLSLFELIYHFTVRPMCRKKAPVASKKDPPAAHSEKNGNGHSNSMSNFQLSQAEFRRVNMKPGDDGRYHLQNKNCSKLPTCDTTMCNNDNITPTKNEEPEDSRL